MKLCAGALIFLLGLNASAANVVAPTKSELEAMYGVAARELNAGHLSEALKQLDAIDARQPDMAAAKNLRGVALTRMGEYGVAEKSLQKARELDPALWEARFNLAEIPFLRKSWAEARRRFEALADAKSEQAQGATGDLIQFKILLTYLLEDKEKKAKEILDRLQQSTASPAYYCGKAALALHHRDKTQAKVALKAAEKTFPPQLLQLFVESFYEVGWLQKPEGAVPATLEVASLADRAALARANFGKAEQAYRQGDYDGALQLLDQVDAIAANQAMSYNLRGEILLAVGRVDEAETALHNALGADPQFPDARYNLARIPFQKRDFESARKQFEAILGATSGNQQQRPREELIRYQIFLTLLLEGRDGPAQKAMDEFKMMDDTPALYYAQAAWAFQHGNAKQAEIWMSNAGNLFPEDLIRAFAAPFADLGWKSQTGATLLAKQTPPPESPTPSPKPAGVPPPGPTNAPVLVANAPEIPLASPKPTATPPLALAAKSPTKAVAHVDELLAAPEPEASATPEKVASKEKSADSADRVKKKRKSKTAGRESSARSKRTSSRARAARPEASPSPPEPPLSPVPPETERLHQNFGDKVARFVLYPWQHPRENAPSPSPSPSQATTPAAPRPRN